PSTRRSARNLAAASLHSANLTLSPRAATTLSSSRASRSRSYVTARRALISERRPKRQVTPTAPTPANAATTAATVPTSVHESTGATVRQPTDEAGASDPNAVALTQPAPAAVTLRGRS